jgi:hypothetical protein
MQASGDRGDNSGRVLAPRAAEIRDALLSLPHVQPLDALADGR